MAANSNWHGFVREDFVFGGRDCIIVSPDEPLPGAPYVWRTEFFDAFAQCDLELVRQGFHLVYIRLSDMYGCPEAVRGMKAFYDYLKAERGFGAKPILLGFSRGGLYAANFALEHGDCTGALYLDAPVLDCAVWPCDVGGALPRDYAREREECLRCYGADMVTIARTPEARPVLRGAELAARGIPVAIVAGAVDDVVPWPLNGRIFARDFVAAGGALFLQIKPGCGHHPHSLEDVRALCGFLSAAALRA